MRLFVAVDLPAEAAAALAETLGREPDPTWHLTLAFLGEQPAAEPVVDALSAVPFTPFRLALAGAGTFGRRVLWAGVGEGREQLTALAASVAEACRAAGAVLEDRPYRPHLTVARGRDLQPGALADHVGPAWSVDGFALKQSAGGRHLTLARLPPGR